SLEMTQSEGLKGDGRSGRTITIGSICVSVPICDIVQPLSYFRGISWSDILRTPISRLSQEKW
ncbi:MAG TPA: hypothetical protein VMV76_02270, partial [Dehalococcoidia bacterium]|nr:hypothetical protein [Dehalococcoidia bacterium]